MDKGEKYVVGAIYRDGGQVYELGRDGKDSGAKMKSGENAALFIDLGGDKGIEETAKKITAAAVGRTEIDLGEPFICKLNGRAHAVFGFTAPEDGEYSFYCTTDQDGTAYIREFAIIAEDGEKAAIDEETEAVLRFEDGKARVEG